MEVGCRLHSTTMEINVISIWHPATAISSRKQYQRHFCAAACSPSFYNQYSTNYTRLAATSSQFSYSSITDLTKKLSRTDAYVKPRTQVYATMVEKCEETHPPVPRSIHDISNGAHILGFGAELGEDHPGYYDSKYKERRSYIADLAKKHKIGQPIPDVEYSVEETRVWGNVLNTLVELYPTHACKEYLETYHLFDFRSDRIPQLQELSESLPEDDWTGAESGVLPLRAYESSMLQKTTGWQIRPVAGLLHPREFLNAFAFRTFHSTQYIRHGSNPMYTPEPDICHEILGHVPMFADPSFAELAWVIGQASLGASEKDLWHLAKLYWYTVEFGTVKEDEEIRAFGAGLLSSFGELKHMRDGTDGVMPEFVELDPFTKLPKTNYKDGFQKKYYLCDSFTDTVAKLRAYSRSICNPKLSQ